MISFMASLRVLFMVEVEVLFGTTEYIKCTMHFLNLFDITYMEAEGTINSHNALTAKINDFCICLLEM